TADENGHDKPCVGVIPKIGEPRVLFAEDFLGATDSKVTTNGKEATRSYIGAEPGFVWLMTGELPSSAYMRRFDFSWSNGVVTWKAHGPAMKMPDEFRGTEVQFADPDVFVVPDRSRFAVTSRRRAVARVLTAMSATSGFAKLWSVDLSAIDPLAPCYQTPES